MANNHLCIQKSFVRHLVCLENMDSPLDGGKQNEAELASMCLKRPLALISCGRKTQDGLIMILAAALFFNCS